MRLVYDDGDTHIEAHHKGAVWFSLEGDGPRASRWYEPDEAVAIGHALIAAGESAGQLDTDGG